MELLKGSPLIERRISDEEDFLDQYALIAEGWSSFRKRFSYNEFRKMMLVVASRHLYNQNFGEYLVPFVDMLNHSPSPNVIIQYIETDLGYHGVYVRSSEAIPKGHEVLWNYGDKGNQHLL